jgi:hypothetical protein
MDIFDAFASDEKLEIEGRWVDYAPGIRFKIARASNKHFSRLFTREYAKNRMVLEAKGEAAEAKSDELMAKVFAKTILVDWEGPIKFQKKDYSVYSVEKAEEMLRVKDFRRWVASQSEDFDAYKAVQEAEDAKN